MRASNSRRIHFDGLNEEVLSTLETGIPLGSPLKVSEIGSFRIAYNLKLKQ